MWRVEVDLIDHGQVEATGLEAFGTSVHYQLTSRDPDLLEVRVLFVTFVDLNELIEVLAIQRTVQVWCCVNVEQEHLLISCRLRQQPAVEHHRVIDATVTLVDRGTWILQNHDLDHFWVVGTEELVQAAATATLLVRLNDTGLLAVVRDLAGVDDTTATDWITEATYLHVLAQTGGHVGHDFSDNRRSRDRLFGVVAGKQTA
ncbi:hypothetical protein D3C72_1045010 [compost metagenome]